MQKLLLKFSLLLVFLLLFSCAKDNDLTPLPEQTVEEQVLQAKKKCDIPCRKPDWINMGKIGSCSAKLSWGFNTKTCGTFRVQLYNHSTGEWTFYDPATSPLTLSDLEPCTQYTVGVSHITDQCASIPLKISFQTDCKPCKEDCKIACQPLDYFLVENISTDGAIFNFGHNPGICGTFTATLENNETGVVTYYSSVSSPWELTGLDLCTSYTIGVAHVTDIQACLPAEKSFTTLCENGPCEVAVLSELSVITDWLGFNVPGVIGLEDNDFQCTGPGNIDAELCPVETYMSIEEPILRLEPGVDFTALFCYTLIPINTVAPVDVNIWVDFNDDGVFDADELIVDFSIDGTSSFCVSNWEPENIPSEGACQVPARYIISLYDEIVSPCDDIQSGQIIDFWVDIGDCSSEI